MADEAATLRLLAVEDDPADQSWLLMLLDEATLGPFHISFVPTMADAEVSLQVGEVDCVLLDLSLPDSWGIDSVGRILAAAPHVPVVVITGSDDQDLGLLAIERGAHDYLVKGRITGDVVLRSAQWAAARAEGIRRRAPGVATLLEVIPAAWGGIDDRAVVRQASPDLARLLGRAEDELAGRPVGELLDPEHRADTLRHLHSVLTGEVTSLAIATRLAAAGGAAARPTILTAVQVLPPTGPPSLLFVLSAPVTTGVTPDPPGQA